MEDVKNPQFAAWIEAERNAYEAVHRLHQSTQGGRLTPPPGAVSEIVALRRTANHHLAQLSQVQPPAVRRPRGLVPRKLGDSTGFPVPRPQAVAPAQIAL